MTPTGGDQGGAGRSGFDRAVRPLGSAERLAALRILVGAFACAYLAARAASFASVARFPASDFAPTGVARLLSAPLPPWSAQALVVLTIATAIPFILGLRFRFTGPLFAALFLWVTSYKSSFGFLFHTENLVVLHVWVLALSDASAAWSLDARRKPPKPPNPELGWPVRLLSMVTVATYVLAGVAKLRMTGVDWITGDVLREHIAFDNARKAILGDSFSRIGAALVRTPSATKPFAALAVALEIGAPLAFIGKRCATVWVASAIAFHAGVALTMAIVFSYPLSGVAFLSFFAPERLVAPVLARLRRPKE